jgi:DNA-binding transcriptional LysR family regulator
MLYLKDLHCFILVYEVRNFSRAADILDTVQSLISSRIHRLEQSIGAPLFLRVHRGVRPTGKGDLLYQHARRVVRDVEELECAVKLYEAELDRPPRHRRPAKPEVDATKEQFDALEKALDQMPPRPKPSPRRIARARVFDLEDADIT